MLLLLRKIYYTNYHLCVFVHCVGPICYCIPTETRVVVCKTRKLIKQNMPFNTPAHHACSIPQSLKVCLMYSVGTCVTNKKDVAIYRLRWLVHASFYRLYLPEWMFWYREHGHLFFLCFIVFWHGLTTNNFLKMQP